MSSEQQAFLCVADITGYTGYLNASELEHARGTLTDLLGVPPHRRCRSRTRLGVLVLRTTLVISDGSDLHSAFVTRA